MILTSTDLENHYKSSRVFLHVSRDETSFSCFFQFCAALEFWHICALLVCISSWQYVARVFLTEFDVSNSWNGTYKCDAIWRSDFAIDLLNF